VIGTRSAHIPFEYVVAELATAPLGLPGALSLSLTEIDPNLRGSTGQLWRETENTLLSHLSAYSVDELVALRDWLWFGDLHRKETGELEAVPIGAMLSRFAKNTLIFAGDSFRPRRPQWSEAWREESALTDDPLARRYWRWIAFAMPPDLLIAAHPEHGEVATTVEVVSPVVRQILLDDKYVEPHMHLGAALDFPLLWIALQHGLARVGELTRGSFASPGAVLNDGRDLGMWLIQAAIARYLLAAFLRQWLADRDSGSVMAFQYFVNEVGERAFAFDFPITGGEDVRTDTDQRQTAPPPDPPLTTQRRYFDPGAVHLMRLCLENLALGRSVPEDGADALFVDFQRLFDKLTRVNQRWPEFPDTLLEALRADPIGGLFHVEGLRQRSSEIQFVSLGMTYLRSAAGRRDTRFARIFWQVIRVRCLFYRHVVQRPMTPGLQWFIRFYGRLYAPRKPMSMALMTESAAVLCGKDLGLKSLEVRLAPAEDAVSVEKSLREIIGKFRAVREAGGERGARRRRGDAGGSDELVSRRRSGPEIADNDANVNHPCEYGIVLHFTKDRGGGGRAGMHGANGTGTNSDPSLIRNIGFRFSDFYRNRRRQALAVAAVLQRYPRALYYLRGIDVCTDELGVPNWVLMPLVRYLKEVSREASAYLQAVDRTGVPALRTTAHAGEDFLHLLGGLRRVDETIEYLQMSQGDRLGHGLALGVNPIEWATQTRGVAISRMERLKDLAWEWKFTTQHMIPLPASRIQFVLDEIERLSRQVFGVFAQPPQIVEFLNLLHSEEELRLLGFPHHKIPDLREYVNERYNDTYSKQGRIPLHANRPFHSARGPQEGEAGRHVGELWTSGGEPWVLLYRYLIEPETFRQGQVQILIDPSKEADTLDCLQRQLRKKVGNLGISIEVNPSSNLLIGNMADLRNHPVWRLNPPRNDEDLPPISVCIGSDDPITFATSTRAEYQLVYDTLTLAGLSDFEARSWLDSARKVGLGSRFTFEHDRDEAFVWTPMHVPIDNIKLPP
jgi:hypothetical protein